MSKLVQEVREAAEAAGFKVTDMGNDVLSVVSEDVGAGNVVLTFGEDNYVSASMLLFDKDQLTTDPTKRLEALDTMIEASTMLPLSSVGKIENDYLLDGQLIATGSAEVIEEIKYLYSNYVVVLKMVREFLV